MRFSCGRMIGAFFGIMLACSALADPLPDVLRSLVGTWEGQSVEGNHATLQIAPKDTLGMVATGSFDQESAFGPQHLKFDIVATGGDSFLVPLDTAGAVEGPYVMIHKGFGLRFVRLVQTADGAGSKRHVEEIKFGRLTPTGTMPLHVTNSAQVCVAADGVATDCAQGVQMNFTLKKLAQ